MSPTLQRNAQRLSDRDVFVHALLGAVSVAERVIRSVEGLAAKAPAPEDPKPRRAETRAPVFALLGAYSAARKLVKQLRSWTPATGSTPTPSDEVSTARWLLR